MALSISLVPLKFSPFLPLPGIDVVDVMIDDATSISRLLSNDATSTETPRIRPHRALIVGESSDETDNDADPDFVVITVVDVVVVVVAAVEVSTPTTPRRLRLA